MNSVTNWKSVSTDLAEQLGFFTGLIQGAIEISQDEATFDEPTTVESLKEIMAEYGDVHKLVNEIVQKHTRPDPRVAMNN